MSAAIAMSEAAHSLRMRLRTLTRGHRMTITSPLPPPAVASGVRLIPVGRERWRVLDTAGRALGQLVASGDDANPRYRAGKFRAATGTFYDIGEFCRASEALECLRLLR